MSILLILAILLRGLATGISEAQQSCQYEPTDSVLSHQSINVSVGGTIHIECPIASSSDTMKYMWYKDNQLLTYKRLLHIQNATSYDGGQYRCSETRAAIQGCLTQVNFTVHVPKGCSGSFNATKAPLLRNRYAELRNSETEGSKILFACSLKHNNPNAIVRWYKDGLLDWMDNSSIQNRVSLKKGFKLQLTSLKKSDKGTYLCRVYNCKGFSTTSFQLYIETRDEPVVLEPSGNRTLMEGNSLLLNCYSNSEKTLYYQWLQWTDTITNSERCWYIEKYWNLTDFPCDQIAQSFPGEIKPFNCIKGVRDKGVSMSFERASLHDGGRYTCVIMWDTGYTYKDVWVTVIQTNETNQTGRKQTNHTILWILIGSGSVLSVAAVVLAYFALKYKRNSMGYRNGCHIDQSPFPSTTSKLRYNTGGSYVFSTTYDDTSITMEPDEWEFPHDSLNMGGMLGEGAFGQVRLAEACGIVEQNVTTLVAVKMLKAQSDKCDLLNLVSELKLMKTIGKHANIINMLGCCTQHGPLFVIVEYAKNGNLCEFLRKKRSSGCDYKLAHGDQGKSVLAVKNLLTMAYQVAQGMQYLASKKCIHRDLAARNVLVMEDLMVKIADFGLARDVKSTDYYRRKNKGRLPIKWMAPETLLDHKFTTQSDVWSFGVLLWEVMTLGMTPYPGIPADMMLDHIKAGKKMAKPDGCPLEVYELMTECWQWSQLERPTFDGLIIDFTRLLEHSKDDMYVDIKTIRTPDSSTLIYEENSPLNNEM